MDFAMLTNLLKQQNDPVAVGYHYDMMHDEERNAAYAKAIAAEIEEDDFVLDIGAGSGLLSLLASRTLAQHIFACEADPTLATAARAVVDGNGLADRITVRPKPSTALSVSWSGDLPCKADVLVTEIFDSVLLGEGVLPTLRDAHERLLAPGAKVVPHAATIEAVLLSCEHASAAARLMPTGPLLQGASQPDGHLRPAQTSPDATHCHADELIVDGRAVPLSEIFTAWRFEFTQAPALSGAKTISVTATSAGMCNAVLIWFTLQLDSAGNERLDMRPHAFDAVGQFVPAAIEGRAPQRGHWKQAICLLPGERHVAAGETIQLAVYHDDWSPAFAWAPQIAASTPPAQDDAQPISAVEWAGTVAAGFAELNAFPRIQRSRLLQLNSRTHTASYARWLGLWSESTADAAADKASVVIAVGDSALFPLSLVSARQKAPQQAASTGLERLRLICVFSNAEAVARVQALLRDAFGLAETPDYLSLLSADISRPTPMLSGAVLETILSTMTAGTENAVGVVCEPYFEAMFTGGVRMLSVDALFRIDYEMRALRSSIPANLLCPTTSRLMVVPIECAALWARRQPVGFVEGFDLSLFNEYAPRPADGDRVVDVDLGPWVRSSLRYLAAPVCLVEFGSEGSGSQGWAPSHSSATARITATGTCHAALLWTETFVMAGDSDAQVDCSISTHKHGAWFFTAPPGVQESDALQASVECKALTDNDADDTRAMLRGCALEWQFGIVQHG